MAEALPLKCTALHYKHLAVGATMVDDSGWQRPKYYGSPEEELMTVQKSVGLCDISPVGKLDLKGKEIAPMFERLFSAGALPQVGHVQRMTLRNTDGVPGVEEVCCRLSNDHVLLLTEPGTLATVEQTFIKQTEAADGCVHLTNLTSVLAAVQLVGPYSRALLSKLTALDLSLQQFADLTC